MKKPLTNSFSRVISRRNFLFLYGNKTTNFQPNCMQSTKYDGDDNTDCPSYNEIHVKHSRKNGSSYNRENRHRGVWLRAETRSDHLEYAGSTKSCTRELCSTKPTMVLRIR